MRNTEVERKLADWHQTHKQLQRARLRLEAAADPSERAAVEKDVHRLRHDSDAALEAVHAAMAMTKPGVRASSGAHQSGA
jgi:hypothetical protein